METSQLQFFDRKTISCVSGMQLTMQLIFIFGGNNKFFSIVTPTKENIHNTLLHFGGSQQYDFYLKYKDESYGKLILPQVLTVRLKRFLSLKNHSQYDCAMFANFLCIGLRYRTYENLYERDFFLENVTKELLESHLFLFKPILFFEDVDYENESHVAIYLGNGMLLNKLGYEGTIAISKLEDLKSIYGDTLFTPRSLSNAELTHSFTFL